MNTIIRAIITEQSMTAAQTGKFTFLVDKDANKNAIRQAIEKAFNVHVVGISTIMMKGRSMRTGVRRLEVKLSPTKKAIVQLAAGEKIGLFELGGGE